MKGWNKMNYNTGKFLSDGSEIMLGDKLKGSQTNEVVVKWDEEKQDYGVEIIGKPEFWFTLDEFFNTWDTSLRRTGNILERQREII